MADDISVQDLIRQESLRLGVPPELALAVAEQESSFNPTARGPMLPSKEQAIGTFQLLPSTAQRLGVDPTDPVQNIQGGVKYLRELLDAHQGDLSQTLAEYGGVKSNTTYVPGVLGRLQKFSAAPQPPPAPASQSLTPPPPAPRSAAGRVISAITSGFDPRTQEGRRNLAGAAGALTAGAMTGGVGLLPFAAGVAGAAGGGALAEIGEQAVGGQEPNVSRVVGAGVEQGGMEAMGGAVMWPIRRVGKAVLASKIGKDVEVALGKAFQTAQDAVSAVRSRYNMGRPAISASQAGRMAESTIQGPAKTALSALGETVEQAAETGPAVATEPLQARLSELSAQITPSIAHTAQPEAEMVMGQMQPASEIARLAAMQKRLGGEDLGVSLPEGHPLPGVLGRIEGMLKDQPEISYADAHKIKRMLDEAVSWDRTAKKQAEQITKGFRQTLREEMAGHAPYDEATAAYESTVQLHRKGLAPQLHKVAIENPESLIGKIKGNEPTKAMMLRDLLLTEAPKAGGTRQGKDAWNAVRAAWTYEKLVKGGPDKLLDRIDKLDPEFVQTLYGDASGSTVLGNLKQIGQALKDAEARVGDVKATKEAFRESSLAREPNMVVTAGRLGALVLTPHSPWAVRAAVQLLQGTDGRELLQWASYSPKTTQMLTRAILSPLPNLAIADLLRLTGFANKPLESYKPMASHGVTPPPQPSEVTLTMSGRPSAVTPPPAPGR